MKSFTFLCICLLTMLSWAYTQDLSLIYHEKTVSRKSSPRLLNIDQQFQEIVRLQGIKVHQATYNAPISSEELAQIEKMLDEPLPIEFKQLYAFANGQKERENGLFFYDEFLNAAEIISTLEISRSLVKPENKVVEYPEQSQKLLQKIVDFYFEQINRPEKKSWFKVEFTFGLGVFSGIHLFADKNTPPTKYELITLADYRPIEPTVNELHRLEEKGYNWDNVKIVLYNEGKYEVERIIYNWDDSTYINSSPENAIKKKYFHYKWLPIFGDGGGNFIGIDLDPDPSGKKGQIINFGRDEEQMVVLAGNLTEFFDFILAELKKEKSPLKNLKIHIHDQLKKLKTGQK